MYGLPIDFDASVFVDKRLDSISFAEYVIHFTFDEVQITVESSFIHKENSTAPAEQQSIPVMSSDLMSLVGHTVNSAEGRTDGTLTLHFDNEHILVILDDSKQYESYQIRIGDKEIIV